ncbi:FAD binding domain-containing protein [Terrimonas rubra]|uniref:FAD binding domain-containing protein n=1 Tax=Terrimonas rubra TaxID=1035890 RepID=A0ABW6AB74_9BACT
MRPFLFTRSSALNQALAKKNNSTQFIAGGTNLVDLMKKNIAQPENLVDITTALPAKIQATAKGLQIGAMVRNSAITNDATVKSKYPLLAKAILAGASPQIRNMASTGGNLLQRTRCPYFYDITTPCNKRKPGSGCSALQGQNRMSAIVGYSDQCVAVHPSDMCVALAALDATVTVTTKNNQQQQIAFKDFHRLPESTPDRDNNLPANALIHAVTIPDNPFNKNYAYIKLRDRDSYAFALVSVAAALQLSGNTIVQARLASGGVAHKPWRWTEAEQYLKGKPATAASFTEAATIVTRGVKPLSHNSFKVGLLKGAVETALQQCVTISP